MIFKYINYKRNSTRLLNIIMALIDNYEKCSNNMSPSCKNILITHLKNKLSLSKDEIAEWEDFDTDYIKIAHALLTNLTYDLLATGQFNLYHGIINPLGPGKNMLLIYDKCMEYALINNIIDEETKTQERKNLLKEISQIG